MDDDTMLIIIEKENVHMKFKGFATGFLAASILVSTTFVHADDITKALEVMTNKVNIMINGQEVAKAGEGYTLENGTQVPATVTYEDTTYVSVRKMSEALGKRVQWDGTTKTILIKDAPAADVAIATVGDTTIMLSEVNLLLEMLKSQYESMYGPDVWSQEVEGKTVADMVIQNCVDLAQELTIINMVAKEQGVKLSDEELKQVEETVNNLKANVLNPDKHITEELLRAVLKKDKLRQAVYNKAVEEYQVDQAKVTETMKANPSYMDIEKNGYAYYANKVRARHILFSTMDENRQPLSDEKKAEVKKKAEEVLKKIQSGQDFEELVKEHSEDPGSKDNGGEYTFTRGQMVKEFEEAAFSLEEGKVSDLVETTYGYHIIKLEEKISATVEEIDAIKDREKFLMDQVVGEMKQVYFTELMNQWKELYAGTVRQEVVDTLRIK